MRYIFLTTIFSIVFAYEKDMTFTIQAGKMECFYQKVAVGEVIDVEYQVIDASHGELDVSFQLVDPMGRGIVTDYKKPDNSHRHTSTLEGDYRFCFDNTFSTFSEKTVFFDLLIENDEPHLNDYDEEKELELGNSAESYMMRVKDVLESVYKVREHVSTARRLQELLSAHEARDRNLAEDMCDRVMNWSLGQMILMLIVGITQVYFLKSLFEDPTSRGFKKIMPDFMSQN
ncbi:transmembrane emp24 domain-containing protein 5-like isoform X1 [Danaus plexippus]|uniref:transmembrane emp24 domain-containing protein 5-like isoform X1 n=1 Tax=Danaus plexippus TaxID=13037 RepID=UPI002AB17B18|nr:transmembrane emp24 domain-containing protein 5-like isoform X1 [Danaus plexippus]